VSDESTLASLRLADSSLPVGTDSVSYGLEQFAAEDRVEAADDLRALLETYLRRQLGVADLVALRAAHEGAIAGDDCTGAGDVDAIVAADRRLSATTLAAEFRESCTRTGERLLSLQRELRDDPVLDEYAAAVEAGDVPGNHAVVLGAVAGREGVDADEACLVACHGFVTGLLGAAQRLLRLGHTEVQRTVDELRPTMMDAVEDSADRSLDEMEPFAPLVDVASADHERADRRLFVS
jgi:urease accessory protein